MKITRTTLQTYFDTPLPPAEEIADAVMFHAFEIEGVAGDELDINVLPNRASDCNTDTGFARELSAILDIPLKEQSPPPQGGKQLAISLERINNTLGSTFTTEEVMNVCKRLHIEARSSGTDLTLSIPASRPDLVLPEDVVEEVGRILGYDRIVSKELPPSSEAPDQARFRGIERMKDQLIEQGFIEVSTQSFASQGDVLLANPMDKTKPALRTSLELNLKDALERANIYAPLVLSPGEKPKLFEVGTVFQKEGEHIELRMTERVAAWGDAAGTVDNLSVAKLEEYGKDYIPKRYALGTFKPFSPYPFISRDIAVLAPKGTSLNSVRSLIAETLRNESKGLWLEFSGNGPSLFDQFEFPDGNKISFAFRTIFNSMERTLTDDEVNSIMDKVSKAVSKAGYEVR